MRVAIAGSSGLVGHGVATALRAAGHEIVTVGRRSDCDVRMDLASPVAPPRGSFSGCSALIHAAGVIDEDFADGARALAKSREGTSMLAAAALADGVDRIAYFSSAHVYGPLEGDIDESHPTAPRSEYARAHLESETRVREEALRAGARMLAVRPCAVFGPLPDPQSFARWTLIPFDFPRQATQGRIVLKSSGLQRRNFVSSLALGGLIRDWLAREADDYAVANAPGRDELSVYDFALLCARVVSGEGVEGCEVERPPGPFAAAAPFHYLSRLGALEGAHRLEDHVRDLVRALLKKAPQ